MTTRTAATASLSSFGTSTSSSSSCVFDHANRPTKAEARAVRPRAVSCEVVGPGWVDVCCLSNRVSSQFILFIISEEWSASSVCTQPWGRARGPAAARVPEVGGEPIRWLFTPFDARADFILDPCRSPHGGRLTNPRTAPHAHGPCACGGLRASISV
jgi:hypothetical protein